MKIKISKKMATLIPADSPGGAAINEKIGDEIDAGHNDKAGAVTIEARESDIAFLRGLAGERVVILDGLLKAATSAEEQKPHFGEHSAWRALLRQIDPVTA